MDKTKRKVVIAGNWKMNKTPSQASALAAQMKDTLSGVDWCDVVLCVPDLDVAAVASSLSGSNIGLGAQNVHWERCGAYTGESCADMLVDAGIKYVIIGHSERRQYFGETDETVNKRVISAIGAGLTVILCVGELLEQREQGITAEVVSLQTKIALYGVDKVSMEKVIIAYEPVWAIGTGKTATSDQAEEVCALIRGVVSSLYGEDTAQATTIQYGGSMNASNASELLSKPNVDGGLIGGASLKPEDFAVIVNAAK